MLDRLQRTVSDRLRTLGPARVGVLLAFATAVLVGCAWGLPGGDSWSADSFSPRSCGLFAIVETYRPGHYHPYPPLQMALLTVLSLPWIAVAALRVGIGVDALGAELIKPLTMTGIEASARALTLLMGFGVLACTMRLWTRIASVRTGTVAALLLVLNATFIYYAHTGNPEIAYLLWDSLCLLELDRVASGDARERQALLYATAAALTKQTAVGALLLPLPMYLVAVPWAARRASPLRPALWRSVLVATLVYAVVSGALVNPTGYAHHLAFTFGPGSKNWVLLPPGVEGAVGFVREAFHATTHFTSWPVAAASVVGMGLVFTKRGLDRIRLALPLVAGLSFLLFLLLFGKRTDDRFLLPMSLLFVPYAAVAFDRVWERWPRGRALTAVAGALSLIPAAMGVASVDATLLADSRYAAERFLDALPAGTKVEVYGGPIFLPRIPSKLAAVRPGIEPTDERQPIAGIAELVDPAMDPRPRSPDVIVLATELSSVAMTENPTRPNPYGLMQYRDPVSRALFRALYDGSLGYERVLRATCAVPWPLECRSIHASTGQEVWIYERAVRRS